MTNDCTDKACKSNLERTICYFKIFKEYLVGNEAYQEDLYKVYQNTVEEVVTWVSIFASIIKIINLRQVS